MGYPNRVIVAGSRTVNENDPAIIDRVLSRLKLYPKSSIQIVDGGARGGDRIGRNIANKFGLALQAFPANWDLYGKRAGYMRNEQMAGYATELIAIWDGESKGTGHMIDLAKKYNLKITIIYI